MSKKPATSSVKQPNLYELSGDGIQITYTLQPIAGPPQFSYHDAKLSHVFKGDEIRTVETEIGSLVTVTTVPGIDSGSTSFTVLIPKVNLGRQESANITTVGITTLHKFLVVGPAPQGQTELYTVHPMQGTAAFVFT
jgi:hypothetical protein